MKYLIVIVVFVFCTTQIVAQDAAFKKPMINRLNKMADSLSKNLKPWKVPNKVFKVENFGAVGDSSTLNTKAIQSAIDACADSGGGIVLFANGKYVTGTIELKSGVMLEVTKDATLLGSTRIADYPEKIEAFKSVMSENHAYRQSLIYAEKCVNVGIRGKGEIYFRGEKANFSSEETVGKIVDRPFGIRMIQCRNVVLQNIFLHNAAAWMQSYIYCQNLIFDGIKVVNQANYNNDGLDPDGCTNVLIRNCYINAEDDAMCLKGASGMPSSNILIENSTFLSSCNALKIGTDTQGDFFNIVARNLKLGGIPKTEYVFKRHDASSGITLATVDGGNVHDILISNVQIDGTRCPIFMRIGSRLRAVANAKPKAIGYLKNIVIEDVTGNDNYKEASLILGIKDHPISDIVINNYQIKMVGSGDTALLSKVVPENETGYPDARFFIKQGLPAYGFYVRHAHNIHFNKAAIQTAQQDARSIILAREGTKAILWNGKSIK